MVIFLLVIENKYMLNNEYIVNNIIKNFNHI